MIQFCLILIFLTQPFFLLLLLHEVSTKMSTMASTPSAPSPMDSSHKLDLESVKTLVRILNQHLHSILDDRDAQRALKMKCNSRLKIHAQEFFEFSQHSVLSNLYWGIDGTLAATDAISDEDKATRLETSEKMLQIPASLDDHGATLGIPNNYLVCCAYFYLSVVELLRKNEWQVAVHFLHAVAISPRIIAAEFTPGIWPLVIRPMIRTSLDRFDEIDEAKIDELMKWMAKRYKPWLMYYQIMSNGVEGCRNFDNGSLSNNIQRSRSIDSQQNSTGFRASQSLEKTVDISRQTNRSKCTKIKCLKDILKESQHDSSTSEDSASDEEGVLQNSSEDTLTCLRTERIDEEESPAEALNQYKSLSWISQASSYPNPERTLSLLMQTKVKETNAIESISRSFSTSFCDTDVSALSLRKTDRYAPSNAYIEEEEKLQRHHSISSISMNNSQFMKHIRRRSSTRMKKSQSCRTPLPEAPEDNLFAEQNGLLEKLVSKLCFNDEFGSIDDDCTVEIKSIYDILNTKSGLKYSLLKDIILDQLLIAISTSKEERVVRTSVAILSTIITANRSVVDDIKRKGLQLHDLATALKRNVHEAVILIYLINPSPAEIKTLELLPCLVEVVCTSKSYKVDFTSLLLTPPAASLMIIEVLVTAFDYETNSMHLAAISSPRVLSGLLQVPRKDNLDEFISLAAILVKCMRFDAKCRKYLSEFSPLSAFVSLLWSNQKRATTIALEFFNELHRMPRSSSIGLLEQIQKQGRMNNMCALFLLTQNSEPEYKLLAANLLLQLEVLEDASVKCIYREEAAEAILDSLRCEESPATQALSSFILANLGGTYSWTGEPYTVAWLVKKTGLTSAHHRNLIKNYDFLDQCLQDAGLDLWCSKIAQRILHLGAPLFHALEKGLRSKIKRVSRDCLIAAAWLGCELVKGPDELRHAAAEILLQTIEENVHPGLELEERLLACLCIYNYTSGRGMRKIVNLSEGVRESLRRLSNVTWMAEELLKVADYFQPNKWRISCIHSLMMEVGNKSNGAVTALIFYKGQLCSGYADGSVKVWDIKGQTATLVQEMKEHRKAITCFSLYEPGNCLLSGSADKTIKMWQMLQRNVECIEVIPMKESVRRLDSWGELIFAITQSHRLMEVDASRKGKDTLKNKRVKCITVAQGKVYAGCTDSSIQDYTITNSRQQEIKATSKSWMPNKPINSVAIYKDWLYSASSVVEGSKMKDWRRGIKPKIAILPEKGANILAMEVVEDFIYLNCSSSMSSLQIWLRGTQHKVGRLSAGSKITSLVSANDMIICGTEKGLIKGWIPL
ncbi:putative E3 ubiquitin-protein ligase LIN-1 isoform X3 [Andrographis paniculata]|uniref:putative E3 ubiquitin-protein ligase LIN-1 isoform X3 n=1 Tax=Andrographis paniculata TaxID=175694 RepID=UPI0021E70DF2|nr:putative E3 ubiquitin-protein ligase LIN-1 isoform X3 [Andrographis paniculata]